MPEEDLSPAAAKFISSLVKSLQILCNGQVEFCESIELVGHINVRVDHKYKFDYIVDEQVSKEGEDSSTTFLSNSYHSFPPARQPRKKSLSSELDQDIMFSEISENIHGKSIQSKSNENSLVHSHDFCSEDTLVSGEESSPNFSVAVESPTRRVNQTNQMVVKLEGDDDDSNDCMVLPASPGDYEPVGEVSGEVFSSIGPSASFEESQGNQISHTRKRRQHNEQGADDGIDNKVKWEKTFSTDVTASFQCPFCLQDFSQMDQLTAHKYICSYSPLQTPYSFSPVQPSYLSSFPVDSMTCTMCGEVFHSSRDRLNHMNISHGICVYPCHSCNEVFGSSRMLFQHKKSKHGDGVVQLECPQCGKTFTTALNLRGHMNMHKGIRPYKCLKCGETFAYSQSKHRHQKLCSKS